MVRFWRLLHAATIAVCAFPGIVFTVVGLGASWTPESPGVRNVWEMVIIIDYFLMFLLSHILVLVMWLAHWIAHGHFGAPARPVLTTLAVWGTIGTAFFWIRFFS